MDLYVGHKFNQEEIKVKRLKFWFAHYETKCVCCCGWESPWYINKAIWDHQAVMFYIGHIKNPKEGMPQVRVIDI